MPNTESSCTLFGSGIARAERPAEQMLLVGDWHRSHCRHGARQRAHPQLTFG